MSNSAMKNGLTLNYKIEDIADIVEALQLQVGVRMAYGDRAGKNAMMNIVDNLAMCKNWLEN